MICIGLSSKDSDYTWAANLVAEKLSQDYKIKDKHKICMIYKSPEDVDKYKLVFPFFNITGAVATSKLTDYANSKSGFFKTSSLLDDVWISTISFAPEGKDYKDVVDYMSNVPVAILKDKSDAAKEEFKIPRIKNMITQSVNEDNSFDYSASSFLTDTEIYMAEMIRKLSIDDIRGETAGRILYMLNNTDCSYDCFRFINDATGAKEEAIVNARPIKGNIIDLESCIEGAMRLERKGYMDDTKFNVMKLKLSASKIVPDGDKPKITDGNIAAAFMAVYRSKLTYSPQNKCWYYFDKATHGWDTKSNTEIQKLIDDNFCNILSKSINICRATNDEALLEALVSIIDRLKNNAMNVNRVMSILEYRMCDSTFCDITDRKKLMRFPDGVVELRQSGDPIFRTGKPNDYCTKMGKCHFNYDISMSAEDIEKMENSVKDLLDKIFPDRHVLRYAMKYISSILEPGNLDKLLAVLSGCGNNGKTLLCNMIAHSFGDYVVRPSVKQLQTRGAQSASNATPDLVRMDRARAFMYMEPDSGGYFNNNMAKTITGGEIDVAARGLHKDEKPVAIDGKAIIAANPSFVIGIVDKALAWRIVTIPFDAEFCENAEKKWHNERDRRYIHERDTSLMDRYRDLCTAFIRILTIEYYPLYKKEGLTQPKQIVNATHAFINKGDPIHHYITECTIYDTNSSGGIDLRELYDSFVKWYARYYPMVRCMECQSFKNHLVSKGYEITGELVIVGLSRKHKTDE